MEDVILSLHLVIYFLLDALESLQTHLDSFFTYVFNVLINYSCLDLHLSGSQHLFVPFKAVEILLKLVQFFSQFSDSKRGQNFWISYDINESGNLSVGVVSNSLLLSKSVLQLPDKFLNTPGFSFDIVLVN